MKPFGPPLSEPFALKFPEKFNARIDPKGWLMSEKLDGVRCQWTGKGLYTRDGRKLAVPDFFVKKFPRSPLDGELYLGRGKYNALLSLLLNPERTKEDWLKVTYVVFDAPALNIPFQQRLNVPILNHIDYEISVREQRLSLHCPSRI